jgi:patatin-like phospholipase/acyl hydrolase
MKYLLSLDGGGVKSIIQLYFLLELEKDLLEKTGKTVYETFDMYAGNSAGSIVISALVYSECRTIKEIIENFFSLENFERIFKKSWTSNIPIIGSVLSFIRPKYQGSEKYKILDHILSDKKINESNGKSVLITVYSIDEQQAKFFKSYENDNNNGNNNRNNKVSEIVNASSAAPTYFSSAEYTDETGKHYGIDGGVFANNCTDSAYADALKLFSPKEDIRILSIGTGDHKFHGLGSETKLWGPLQWIMKGSFVDIIIDVDQYTADYKTRRFADALGHKYIRVHNKINIDLDDVSKIEELKEIGRKWYKDSKDSLFSGFF